MLARYSIPCASGRAAWGRGREVDRRRCHGGLGIRCSTRTTPDRFARRTRCGPRSRRSTTSCRARLASDFAPDRDQHGRSRRRRRGHQPDARHRRPVNLAAASNRLPTRGDRPWRSHVPPRARHDRGGAMPALELKGKAEPVEAFRLLGVKDREPMRRHDTPLVGRQRELRILREAFDRATHEDACHLFTLLAQQASASRASCTSSCSTSRRTRRSSRPVPAVRRRDHVLADRRVDTGGRPDHPLIPRDSSSQAGDAARGCR